MVKNNGQGKMKLVKKVFLLLNREKILEISYKL